MSRRSNQQQKGQTQKSSPTPSAPFSAGKVTSHHEWAAQPAVNESSSPATLNTIQPGGTPLGGAGVSVAPVDLGALPFLNATWRQAGVYLAWGEPQYDKAKYILQGYNVIQRIYGPLSTAAQNGTTTFVPAGQPNTPTGTFRPFTQTYNFNTGGDVAGFKVEPVFQNQTTGQVFTNPPSGLGVRIGEPIATFGVGP